MNHGLVSALRTETRARHERLHALPYFIRAAKGHAELLQYANHLHVFAILWCSIEHQIAASERADIAALNPIMGSKWPALRLDLAALAEFKMSTPVVDRTLDVVDSLLTEIAQNAAAVIGCAYVLQGSMNGSAVLARKLRDAVKDRNCLNYLNLGVSERRDLWPQFLSRIDAVPLADTAFHAATRAANYLFDALHDIFIDVGELATEHSRLESHITQINPEAGRHTLPDDARAVAAALRAGAETWAAYPYLQLRFGERGKRFAKSDSCWLATLSELTSSERDAQVAWLARLLAGRGIPPIILIDNLLELGNALGNIPDANENIQQIFSDAARKLFAQHHVAVSYADFALRAEALHKKFAELVVLPQGMARILLSAEFSPINEYADGYDSAYTWLTSKLIPGIEKANKLHEYISQAMQKIAD